MTHALETTGLGKSYGAATALSALDLSIPKGMVYGVLGPNGAGKSTLLRMVLGLVTPSRGGFRLLGETDINATVLRRVGAMIEAPSVIWHLDALLPMTDFVSVGTNDLMQYLFAADRGNPRVSERYDFLSPPALRALETIQKACAETGTPVSVCGEMAGRPLEAFVLVALGFEALSMPPAGIGPVKQMVLSCDRAAARRGVQSLIRSTAGSIRNEVETLARKLYLAV